MEKYVCLTCGRPFNEGQGIILRIGERDLTFHSKACAYKFLKEVLQNADSGCISSPLREIYRKYDEIREKIEERAKKKKI
ncbi:MULTISPECIES: hypothetical protein [Acidianus]|uniref:Uncharacterized protein n=1 Tax=Candidatus Acidianus copahuensis TaxID=1160895 RepID=A0A031LMB0_9CREN|nr:MULTISPECIES: hypothetical protein [Acidianus]EZQ06783.1 hypothetical protein CM19_05250 [Candidatus Acidianus copahuensis]NON61791.1 hypothetical protein [Acidianus sp. RZ1]